MGDRSIATFWHKLVLTYVHTYLAHLDSNYNFLIGMKHAGNNWASEASPTWMVHLRFFIYIIIIVRTSGFV